MTIEFSKVKTRDEEDIGQELNVENEFDDTDSYVNFIHVNVYVSAIVPTTDDPSTPSFTFRVMVLGTLWNILLAVSSTIFGFRTNPFSVPSAVATLLSYPMGILMARTIPDAVCKLGPYKFSLNPGSFSIKEHVLIYIIASAGSGVAYGVDNVVMQRFDHYMGNKDVGFFGSLAFVMSLQLLGFGLAGMVRRFLVKPPAMYWPNSLSTVAMFVGFHENVNENEPFSRYPMSRYKFFWIAVAGFFIYTWIPQFFMNVLQAFSIICLLTSNKAARFLTSVSPGKGVGIMGMTLDWIYIGGGSLTAPFYATLQSSISALIFGWIVIPVLFFSDAFGMDTKLGDTWTLNTPALFDKNGTSFRGLALMDRVSYDLNQTAYDQIKPIRITTSFAVQYGTSFLSIAAAVSHVALWYGKSIYKQFKAALKQKNEETDIHNRLMAAYPDVPDWAYLIFLAIMIVVHCIVSVVTPFTMPIWSVFLCLGIVILCLLPFGVIVAVTGVGFYINVLTEFIIGFLIPGQTVAVICFKSLGTNTLIQALTLVNDLKLGHYMKVNPVHMVSAQFYGTVLAAIINTIVAIWSETLLSDLLFKSSDWKAQNYNIFYSAAAIWGSIGPQRFFGSGSVYESLIWWFLYGAALPFIPWIGNKIYKADFWHYINIPLLCSNPIGVGGYQVTLVVPLMVAWIFQNYIFKRHHEWWKKYNYVLASASDTGATLTVFVITILAQLGVKAPIWAGNPDQEIVDFDYYCD